MRGGTAAFTFEFIVALPNRAAVLVRGMPYLGAVHRSAVSTENHTGKDATGTVPFSQSFAACEFCLY